MSTDIKVPALPESVSDATVAKWYKQVGEPVQRDEHLVDIETDKVVLEVVAPAAGSLEKILKAEGELVKAQEVIGLFKAGSVDASKATTSKDKKSEAFNQKIEPQKTKDIQSETVIAKDSAAKSTPSSSALSPSARREAKEIDKEIKKSTQSSVPRDRITKEDMLKGPKDKETDLNNTVTPSEHRQDRREPMTRLRAKIAERLVEAQQTAAILTTFNEINMQPVISLRQKYKESFEKTYGVRLGFMSFFTMAVVEALKHFPILNASVDGTDIVYHEYIDIGIAVSTKRGLVVPVLRNAEKLTMADIEKQISDFAKRAENGSLTLEEITGGTFTISNGGVFGSLMATPILNPPQSGILGMHKIQERPVVENGQIVARSMMYVALSYDHRIIDGSESVRFLVLIKELLEDPARMALGI